MEPCSRFPQVLRGLLAKEGRSQRWLMSQCDFSSATVNRILSGVQEPGRHHVRAICSAFPDWMEQRLLIVALLQDELDASGVDQRRVLLRDLNAQEADNRHLLPDLDGYLRTISYRLMKEQDLTETDKLITRQVEWLSEAVVRLEALEADHEAAYPESEDRSQKAAES